MWAQPAVTDNNKMSIRDDASFTDGSFLVVSTGLPVLRDSISRASRLRPTLTSFPSVWMSPRCGLRTGRLGSSPVASDNTLKAEWEVQGET
jgi:hypothetical protein